MKRKTTQKAVCSVCWGEYDLGDYHLCTKFPVPLGQVLTEAEIRRIVREELERKEK